MKALFIILFVLGTMFITSCGNNEDLVSEYEEYKTKVEERHKMYDDVHQPINYKTNPIKGRDGSTAAHTSNN